MLLDTEIRAAPIDPKTMLQEIVQSCPGSKLEYVVGWTGPDHMPEYTVPAIDGAECPLGVSKKEAARMPQEIGWSATALMASYDKTTLPMTKSGEEWFGCLEST